MPHLTVEYTHNLDSLDIPDLLATLNTTLTTSGHFVEVDIKSRAIRLEHFLVGAQPQPRSFIHAKLALLPGRPDAIKKALADSLLDKLQTSCKECRVLSGLDVQLCVEVLEIDAASYAKTSFLC